MCQSCRRLVFLRAFLIIKLLHWTDRTSVSVQHCTWLNFFSLSNITDIFSLIIFFKIKYQRAARSGQFFNSILPVSTKMIGNPTIMRKMMLSNTETRFIRNRAVVPGGRRQSQAPPHSCRRLNEALDKARYRRQSVLR